jgi:kumamolisin
MYHHYLSKDDLTATYSPTQTDYDAVKNYLISKGLTVTNSDPNRLLIHVEGSAGTVEKALSLSLSNYKKADGSTYMRPDAEPAVSSDVADKISAISGLNTSVKHKPNYTKEEPSIQELESVIQNSGSDYVSATTGYGPIDIKSAYNLSSTPLTGAGQTIALVEFDGYIASDVNYYVNAFKNYFGSSYTPSVIFEPVAGYNGAPITANGASEVMLDIDMALNLAPAATIEVFCDDQYTDNNADVDMLEALYNNLTSGSISESWGIPEVFYAGAGHGGTLDSATDHAYYELLAAEGLSFFAASGDNGTYDAYNDGDSTDLCVNYPASDPNVTGVGGTTLNTTAYTVKLHNEPVTGADGAYKSETPWNDSVSSGYPVGGGGGISALFTIPWYQSLSGIMTSASLGSSTHRNVPDVSLNADQYAGYAVYVAGSTYATPGSWQVYGGTSAATPLWAAFTALVNQNRAANGLSNIGFINPVLYNLSLTPSYATSFHDIADGHTNGYYPTANDYPAVTGYDLATGLGTFNGVNLISALSTETQTPAPTFAPAAGIYPSAQSVSISDSLSGATIFYTTDGSTPDTSSAIYSSPISVSATETINAIAVKSGYTDSQETSASYIISSETQIATPTFSLTPGTYTT